MTIAIASGKGGTGKTTVSVNLARVAPGPTQLLDCDVEEPNDHLFFRGTPHLLETVSLPVPEIDPDLCNGCGACTRFCAYNAIVGLENTPLVFADLCHGCGGCVRVCPTGAIREVERPIGVVETVDAGDLSLVFGRLHIGVPSAPPVIRRVRAYRRADALVLIDAPPGVTCPVIAAARDADFLLLVAEPTPFGINDLGLAIALARELELPFGVVVNRMGIGDDAIRGFCRGHGIPILLEIPEDRRIARVCSKGQLVVEELPEYRGMFLELLERLRKYAGRSGVQWTFS